MFNVVLFSGSGPLSPFVRSLGAYRVATELRRAGYTVKVVDYVSKMQQLDPDFVEKCLLKFVGPSTLWVGFSSTFVGGAFFNEAPPRLNVSLVTLAEIKSKYPKLKVVLGGAHAYTRNVRGIDIYIEGYADTTVVQFTRALDNKLSSVQYTRENNEVRITNDQKAAGFDFVAKGNTEYDSTDLIFPGEPLALESARGCIFTCAFCSFPLNGKSKNDFIKASRVLEEELLKNYANSGTTNYTFVDDTFNDSTDKLRLLVAVSRRLPFRLQVAAYCRADLLVAHPEQVELLAELRLASVFFGIESLHRPSASAVGKGASPEKLLRLLIGLKTAWPNTVTTAGLIVGLPHETELTLATWLPWVTSKDGPFTSIALQALHLRWDKSKIWKSKLELDPTKYGYTPGATVSSWVNQETGLTSESAKELVSQYQQLEDLKPLKFRAFEVPLALSSGIPVDQTAELNRTDPRYTLYNKLRLSAYLNQTYSL